MSRHSYRFTHSRMLNAVLLAMVVVALPGIFRANDVRADNWPQFRGPDGQGHADGDAPSVWSEDKNIVWKSRIPGQGWSSPVVFDEQIWLTTAAAGETSEEERKRRLADTTNSQPLNVVSNLVMRAICIDRESGRFLHDIKLMAEPAPEPIHTLNSFASPTPIIEDGRLYCHFGPNGTACVDTVNGKVLWTNQDLQFKTENGAGSTPVLCDDLLIFHCDGSDTQSVVALNTQDGSVVWKTPRSGKMRDNPQLRKAYGTPLVVEIDGESVLMSPGADWLYAYDPSTGVELWKLNYGELGFSIVPRPVARDGVLYFCTSFMNSELLAVRYAENDGAVTPEILWRFKSQVPQVPSPLLVDQLIYFVSDNGGIVTCLEANTGQMLWRQRLGGNYAASPVYAGGRIYFFDRDGLTHVLKPGRKFELIGENKLDGRVMASAAVVDGSLFVRTDDALYRIEHR